MSSPPTTGSPVQPPGHLTGGNEVHVSEQLLERARADTETVLRELESQLDGLSQAEADSRLKRYGLNEIAREQRQSALMRLLSNVKNPLVLLLTALGVLSLLTGDLRAAVVIFVIIVALGAGLTVSPLAGALGFVQVPPLFWLLLAMILVCYVVLTQWIKTWFIRRFGE
jgi:magnesium-transporting ATPase (P-type)